MRFAYSAFWIASLLLTGCAGGSLPSSGVRPDLPSLVEDRPRRIVQVAANFNPEQLRDAPYFVVCLGDACPEVSSLTPIQVADARSAAAKPMPQPQSSKRSMLRDGQGKSLSYVKRKSVPLPQYRVHFDYASAELDDAAKQRLAQFLRDYPQRDRALIITGFTDNISKPNGPIGNHWLALERALSVKKFLISSGYPEAQVSLEAKFLCCYIDSNESPAGRRNNRRAEISFIHVQ